MALDQKNVKGDLSPAAMTEDKTNPMLPVWPLPRRAPGAQGTIDAEAAAVAAAQPAAAGLAIRDLTVSFGAKRALKQVSMDIPARAVTAIIGPSGCGKSTFLRALNRLHDLLPSARVEGQVRLFGADIYGPGVEPAVVRRRVGMVFQQSNPFPTMSVADNVTVGLRLNGVRDRAVLAQRLHQSLVMATLWDEVKDRLDAPAISLSSGQQQRLCIARALAVQPEVLLMDEPASALDPLATARIEELILELKENFTLVIVTHNMQQAARVSDYTAFFYLGQLVEFGATAKIFTNPAKPQTEDYVRGRFG
jgi:phosphate transport system ATP-binding protein